MSYFLVVIYFSKKGKMKIKKQKLSMIFMAVSILPVSGAYAIDKLSDEWREVVISNKLGSNDVLEYYEIQTEVKDHVAVISGEVSSDAEKGLAEEIAKNVEGVNGVVNNIKVDEEIVHAKKANSMSQRIADATTTARVKSRLLWSSGVPGASVHVNTENGIVTLSGEVPLPAQKELAERLALKTSGVWGVTNNVVSVAQKRAKIGSVDMNKVSSNAGDMVDTAGKEISDAWIDTKVTASLNFTRSLNVRDLGVKTNAGVVTLTGVAYSSADKELASEIAKDIRGVKSVVNLIKTL